MSLSPAEIDRLADAIAERLAGRFGTDADELGDVHDAARWLGCSVPSVERGAKAGAIPSFKVGRLRRYRKADLMGLRDAGGTNE
jgi:excisionase family DNA binding protein